MAARALKTAKRTRIQEVNEKKILDSALEAFGSFGYRGATIEQIARLADMSKPNLLYYFPNKNALYAAILERTLDRWLYPLANMDPNGDPLEEIWAYAKAKLEMSRTLPAESRLFAMEILQGAPIAKPLLETTLKDLFGSRTALFRRWINEGKLAPLEPDHLLFMIWSSTQTYADFWVQIDILSGEQNRDDIFHRAEQSLKTLLMKGLAPEPNPKP